MTNNHHYEYATASFTAVNANAASEFNAECREDAMIQSSLAIAYEQRTANLIALYTDGASGSVPQIDYASLITTITERLGLK